MIDPEEIKNKRSEKNKIQNPFPGGELKLRMRVSCGGFQCGKDFDWIGTPNEATGGNFYCDVCKKKPRYGF